MEFEWPCLNWLRVVIPEELWILWQYFCVSFSAGAAWMHSCRRPLSCHRMLPSCSLHWWMAWLLSTCCQQWKLVWMVSWSWCMWWWIVKPETIRMSPTNSLSGLFICVFGSTRPPCIYFANQIIASQDSTFCVLFLLYPQTSLQCSQFARLSLPPPLHIGLPTKLHCQAQ